MERDHLIDIFSELGSKLDDFGDGSSDKIIGAAIAANGWFTRGGIVSAVESIRKYMLDRDALREWTTRYEPAEAAKDVGVIMAGNIPLVGFFDLLCVLISGHRLYYKASSKDAVLTQYIISLLRQIDPALPMRELGDGSPLDAIIATGSDNTNRYFRSRYGSIPAIFRGSRSSVAVLTGNETIEQLEGLASDIFSYSGLGCRNVSHLIVPVGYDFRGLTQVLDNYGEVNPKFINNYRQRSALLSTEGRKFIGGPFYVLREDRDFPTYVSEITWHSYSDSAEAASWLSAHDNEIQCVAGSEKHSRGVALGHTQSPGLADYPDAVDTMDFLSKF